MYDCGLGGRLRPAESAKVQEEEKQQEGRKERKGKERRRTADACTEEEEEEEERQKTFRFWGQIAKARCTLEPVSSLEELCISFACYCWGQIFPLGPPASCCRVDVGGEEREDLMQWKRERRRNEREKEK